jgi:transcriptional regulator with XRE-family HTH domain
MLCYYIWRKTVEEDLPTSFQVKAARALLGWTQQDLAQAAGKAKRTIAKFELDSPLVERGSIEAISSALVEAGISFINGDDYVGVCVRKIPAAASEVTAS